MMSLGTFGCLPDLSNRINYQQQWDDAEDRKHQQSKEAKMISMSIKNLSIGEAVHEEWCFCLSN